MWFKLQPSELELSQTAPFNFINAINISATPEQVFAVLAADNWQEWFEEFIAVKWTSSPSHQVGATREVKMKPLSARERFLAWDPGRRFSFSIDECTLPLVTAMIEDTQLSPVGDNETLLVWNVYYRPNPVMRLIHPIARAIFGKMFSRALKNLKVYVEKQVVQPVTSL